MFESLAIGALLGIVYLAGLALAAAELRRRAERREEDIDAITRILERMDAERAARDAELCDPDVAGPHCSLPRRSAP